MAGAAIEAARHAQPVAGRVPPPVVEALRTAWRDGSASVVAQAEADAAAMGAGLRAAQALARLAAEVVAQSVAQAGAAAAPNEPPAMSVCLTGGGGAGFMAPHSDWDVLFLPAKADDPLAAAVAEAALYALWDIGVKVGHAVRAPAEAVRFACADHASLTALLDARLIAGDPGPAAEVSARLDREARRELSSPFITAKAAERAARRAADRARGRDVEPDLKTGRGGVRDLQTIAWLRAAARRAGAPWASQLDAALAPGDLDREAAADRLWLTRILTHHAAGRAHERLDFDLQHEIAPVLGGAPGPAGMETGMRALFEALALIARDAALALDLAEVSADAPLAHGWRRHVARPQLTGEPGAVGVMRRGRFLTAPRLHAWPAEPARAFDLARLAAARGRAVDPHARLAMMDLAPEVARRTADPALANAFLTLLTMGEGVGDALRTLHRTGLLAAFAPEWRATVARPQFNQFHAYAVDDHSLAVMDALSGLPDAQGLSVKERALTRRGLAERRDDRAFWLAALVHDTGKGDGDQEVEGAANAAAAARRMGLSPEDADRAAWLVRHHLLMSDVAQRRDLSDPATIAAFAKTVGDARRLDDLYLFTIADIMGVGPGVWTAWKGRALAELRLRARALLADGAPTSDRARALDAEAASAARESLRVQSDWDAAPMWLEALPDAYWTQTTRAEAAAHMALAQAHDAKGRAVAVTQTMGADGPPLLSVVALGPDRPGLFAALARAVTTAGGDIRRANAFPASRGRVLDLFIVAGLEPDGRGPARLEEQVGAALADRPAPPVAPLSPRRDLAFSVLASVQFDDSAAPHATVVEVTAPDRPGVLAAVAGALSAQGLVIGSAHIDTAGERALDAFYVTEAEGGVVSGPERREGVRRAVLDALAESAQT